MERSLQTVIGELVLEQLVDPDDEEATIRAVEGACLYQRKIRDESSEPRLVLDLAQEIGSGGIVLGDDRRAFQLGVVNDHIDLVSSKRVVREFALYRIPLLLVRLLFRRASFREDLRILENIVAHLVQMLKNLGKVLVAGREAVHETADGVVD